MERRPLVLLGVAVAVSLVGWAYAAWRTSGRRDGSPAASRPGDGRIEVLARMPDATPGPGYLVSLFGPPSMGLRPPTVTDAEGRAAFEGLPTPAAYAVRVTCPARFSDVGYDERRAVRLGTRGSASVEVVFPVTRVSGTVVDATTGKATSGATLRAVRTAVEGDADSDADLGAFEFRTDEEAPPLATTIAGADGKFAIEAAGPAISVVASTPDGREGYEFGHVRRGSAANVTLLVMPARLPVVEGVLVDEDRKPVAGASVTSAQASPTAPGVVATSDERGRFRLAVAGAWRMRISVPSIGSTVADVPFAPTSAPTFVVPIRTGLDVRALDDRTGAPVPDVDLSLYSHADGGDAATAVYGFGVAVTDVQGRARLAAPPNSVPRLQVRVAGRRGGFVDAEAPATGPLAFTAGSLATPLARGELRSIELRLRHGTRVRGRVVSEDGRPVARARVSATSQGIGSDLPAVRTGDDGRFEVADVFPPSERTYYGGGLPQAGVVARRDGYVDAWAAVPRAGATVADDVGDVRLVRPGAFVVRVVGADGRPIDGARVRLRGDDTATTADGTAVVACDRSSRRPWHVDPPEHDELTIVAEGFARFTRRVSEVPGPGDLFDLGTTRLVASLGHPVRVVDADGRPVPGVHVLVASNYRATELSAAPTTDADGRVLVHAKSGWEHVDLLTTEGIEYDATLRERATPPGPLVLTLATTRPFVGRVVDEAGAPIARAEVRVQHKQIARDPGEMREIAWPSEWLAHTDADGSFRFRASVTGARGVEVKAFGFVSVEVEAPGDAPSPYVVRLERFGEKHRRRVDEIQARLVTLRRDAHEARSLEELQLGAELRRLRGE